jgi:predicted anti-sigma-YlaC factor YlaD
MAAISAEIDGEAPGVDPRLLAAHLEGCAECRRFRDGALRLRSATSVRPAPGMPDLSRRVSKLNAIADRTSRWGLIRGLLALVALEIFVVALPALLLGEEDATSAHAARHLGAFSVAYAVALVVVVIRPARARSILPVTAVLAGALVITAAIDIGEGNIPLLSETAHLPEILSVVLVWLLARPVPDPGQTRAVDGGLRIVADVAEDPAGDERSAG